jgi:3-hydroxyacyl-CoA dehydrogenase
MKKIGVVGAGTTGSQIGLVFADGGFGTLLYDLTNERLDLGREEHRESSGQAGRPYTVCRDVPPGQFLLEFPVIVCI